MEGIHFLLHINVPKPYWFIAVLRILLGLNLNILLAFMVIVSPV